jgi:signal transduction histidine kinase
MKRWPLQRQMLLWMLGYIGLMTLAVFGAAHYLHERAEHLVWRALLASELDSVEHRLATDPGYRWQDSDTLRLYSSDAPGGLPAPLRRLPPGVHDGVRVGGRPSAVMVRQVDPGKRMVMALDITDFEALENFVARWSLLAGAALVLITWLMAMLGMNRVVRPLSSLAGEIGRLRPDRPGQRLLVDPHGSAELHVIASALNDYLARNERFVERERTFIRSASHELRTPVAVISGAATLALEQRDLPPGAREQIQRISRTAQGIEQLIGLLLLLARDPARLSAVSDVLPLQQVIRDSIADHEHLTGDKQLRLVSRIVSPCEIVAPLMAVQAAVGNLLRNAIENSDSGDIVVTLEPHGLVTIEDPGHGMTPEQISQLYARMARSDSPLKGGIGLDLIGRLCAHLGWKLSLDPRGEGKGMRVTLDFGAGQHGDDAGRTPVCRQGAPA